MKKQNGLQTRSAFSSTVGIKAKYVYNSNIICGNLTFMLNILYNIKFELDI